MDINSKACEEDVLNTIDPDLRRVYWGSIRGHQLAIG